MHVRLPTAAQAGTCTTDASPMEQGTHMRAGAHLRGGFHAAGARQDGDEVALEARAGLHAAAGHLLVVVEAVAHARRAHAVPDRGLEEERVRRHAVQRHLLQDVPEQVRPAGGAKSGSIRMPFRAISSRMSRNRYALPGCQIRQHQNAVQRHLLQDVPEQVRSVAIAR